MTGQPSDEGLEQSGNAVGGPTESAVGQAHRARGASGRVAHYVTLAVVVCVVAVGIALLATTLTPEHSGQLPPGLGEVSGGSLALDTRAFSLEPGHTYTVSGTVPVYAELEPAAGAEGEPAAIAEVPAGGAFTILDTGKRSGGETLYSVRVSDGTTTVEGWIHPVSLMGLEVTDAEATEQPGSSSDPPLGHRP